MAAVKKSGVGEFAGACIGFVVPKRLARRAVTRNLIKRQMRQALAERHAAPSGGLPDGGWVLRLRSGFDRSQYPSAASEALKRVTRSELVSLVEEAAARAGRAERPQGRPHGSPHGSPHGRSETSPQSTSPRTPR